MACMGPEFWYMALEVREMAPNLDTVGRSPKGMRSSSPASAARRCMSSRCSRMALLSTFWTRCGKDTQKLIQRETGSQSFYNSLVSAVSYSHILYSLHFSTSFPLSKSTVRGDLSLMVYLKMTITTAQCRSCKIVVKSRRREQQQMETETEKVKWEKKGKKNSPLHKLKKEICGHL